MALLGFPKEALLMKISNFFKKEEKCKHHHCAFSFLASVFPHLP